MSVPLLDLRRVERRIGADLRARWETILQTSAFVLGPEVAAFERDFATYTESAGCVGVANGTDALVLALRALDLRPGDEVIVPDFTFFATAEAVALCGGVPVLCDIDPHTFNLDPEDAARRVTDRTVGIMGVHLYGTAFDVDAVRAICERHGLWLLEDSAQAQGARWKGRRVGGLGTLSAWSFYPTKNLGCFGDGGAVTGPDAALLARVRSHANHGQTQRYYHAHVGTNSRLDALQAAVLNCRLPLLDGDNARRREHAALYRQRLGSTGDVRFVEAPPEAEPVFHQVAFTTARRDALIEHLKTLGIGAAVHYPVPLHRQPALAGYGMRDAQGDSHEGNYPVSTRAAAEVVCLPIFAELETAEIEQVCDAVAGFFAG